MERSTKVEKAEATALHKLRGARLATLLASLAIISLVSIYSWAASATLRLPSSCFTDGTPWRTADRMAMFVACNAILALLIKDSGLLGHVRPSPDDDRDYDDTTITGDRTSMPDEGSLEGVVSDGADGVVEQDGSPDVAAVELPQEEEEADGDLELKKLFDEFIEKVKRERRLEAMQLLLDP